MSENINVAGVIGVNDFDYTTVHPSLVCGNVYTKKVKEAVSAWNTKARSTGKYPKVSVQTLNSRIIKLSCAKNGKYSEVSLGLHNIQEVE